jgi:lysophospholipase L1-like esterase
MTLEEIEGNLQSMAILGKAAGIQVLLASVMPTNDYIHKMTDRRPNEKIVQLNQWIQNYCQQNGLIYVDYYSAMLDDQKVLKKELSDDGLHPNAAGYDVITPIAAKAIAEALGK